MRWQGRINMSRVEAKYDQLLSQLRNMLGPIDEKFATRLMYLERKGSESFHPSVKPHVVLTIHYKDGVDRKAKQSKLRSKSGFMVELADPNDIHCMGYMNMDDIMRISSDFDIEKVTGKASPTIRG